ncbi:MAG: squalene/phytoene synthase family protein [Planctomycetaceae bacterium]|nr:squalene/phytoene synthase family protein [Planctomycetaceae bacterium]
MISIAKSYELCARICAASGSNFIAAFRFLPQRERRAMEAIYAFMRTADDLADSDAPLLSRERALQEFQTFFELALKSMMEGDDAEYLSAQEMIFPALLEVIQQYRIPPQYFFDVLDGVRMDLVPNVFQTAEDLEAYAYRVASAVGLICLHVWGVPPEELLPNAQTPIFRAAAACGKALQWTNILRDIREDAKNGRYYLPLNELKLEVLDEDPVKETAAESVSTELMELTEQVRKRILAGDTDFLYPAIQKNLQRAERFYQEASLLSSSIPVPGRRVFQIMTGVYYRIFLKIRRDPAKIFQKRIKLSKMEKIFLYFRILFG